VFQGVWTDFVKGASRPLQCCDTCNAVSATRVSLADLERTMHRYSQAALNATLIMCHRLDGHLRAGCHGATLAVFSLLLRCTLFAMLSSLLSAAITVLLFAPGLLSVALAMLPRPHSAALAVLPSQCCLRCAAVTLLRSLQLCKQM
jgi:hypothetical protein